MDKSHQQRELEEALAGIGSPPPDPKPGKAQKIGLNFSKPPRERYDEDGRKLPHLETPFYKEIIDHKGQHHVKSSRKYRRWQPPTDLPQEQASTESDLYKDEPDLHWRRHPNTNEWLIDLDAPYGYQPATQEEVEEFLSSSKTPRYHKYLVESIAPEGHIPHAPFGLDKYGCPKMKRGTPTKKTKTGQKARELSRPNEPVKPHADRCLAKLSDGSGVCNSPAGFGTDHLGIGRCSVHGGNLLSHRNNAIAMKAKERMRILGAPKDIDPYSAVLEDIRRTAGHIDWLNEFINRISEANEALAAEEDFGDPELAAHRKTLEQFTEAGFDISVAYKIYHEERKHLVQVSQAAVRMGIAERQIQIAEEQGRQIATVLQNFLHDAELGLTNMQLAKARNVMQKHLRAMHSINAHETANQYDSPNYRPDVLELPSEEETDD